MDPGAFNLYLVLDLDPKVRDPAAVLGAIESQKKIWSRLKNRGSSQERVMAALNSERVKELRALAGDPVELKRHADEARQFKAATELNQYILKRPAFTPGRHYRNSH